MSSFSHTKPSTCISSTSVPVLTQGEGSLQREVGGLSENCSTDRRKDGDRHSSGRGSRVGREPGASARGELGREDMRGPDEWARADQSAR